MRKQLALALTLIIIATTVLASGKLPSAGAAAPAFTLENEKGARTSLSDFKGKWVVLYFYPKDFTSGCTLQARNFQRDLAKYRQRDAVIVGVSVDTARSHEGFCAKEGLDFTLLADTDARVSAAYGSTLSFLGKKLSARNTFLIDPSGKIARVYQGVQPAGHSAEVLADLDRLRAAK